VIWASNYGAQSNRAWYYNLKAHPHTSIEVGSGTIDVGAEETTGGERERLLAKVVERYS
jgi:deazaflavin-dependent oxidoreductase (nitroreductase family)